MEYTKIIKKQTDYFNSNQTKDINCRIEQLKKLKSVIKNNESILY
jgi:aldehyde dehydrogenase (NAD+)